MQDIAAALGVQARRVGRIALYPAGELVDAINRAGGALEPGTHEEHDDAGELEQMRRAVARKATKS